MCYRISTVQQGAFAACCGHCTLGSIAYYRRLSDLQLVVHAEGQPAIRLPPRGASPVKSPTPPPVRPSIRALCVLGEDEIEELRRGDRISNTVVTSSQTLSEGHLARVDRDL